MSGLANGILYDMKAKDEIDVKCHICYRMGKTMVQKERYVRWNDFNTTQEKER